MNLFLNIGNISFNSLSKIYSNTSLVLIFSFDNRKFMEFIDKYFSLQRKIYKSLAQIKLYIV